MPGEKGTLSWMVCCACAEPDPASWGQQPQPGSQHRAARMRVACGIERHDILRSRLQRLVPPTLADKSFNPRIFVLCADHARQPRAIRRQSQEADMNTPAASATQVIIVGGGPVGMGLAIELGQRGIRTFWSSATQTAADPQGPEPDPADHGAFPFLGRGKRAARGTDDPEGLRHRRHDRLRHPAQRPRTTGCSASWFAPITSRTTSGCRNTRPKRFCGTPAPVPSLELMFGWSATASCRMTAA